MGRLVIGRSVGLYTLGSIIHTINLTSAAVGLGNTCGTGGNNLSCYTSGYGVKFPGIWAGVYYTTPSLGGLKINCVWTLNTARYWGAKLADHDVFWLEEPMHPFDKKAHAELARSISVPIALGETVYTKWDFRDFIDMGAVDIGRADATKLSGIDEWLEVAALAAANNKPVIPHTNVQHKLHVQLAAATPGVMMVENCTSRSSTFGRSPSL